MSRQPPKFPPPDNRSILGIIREVLNAKRPGSSPSRVGDIRKLTPSADLDVASWLEPNHHCTQLPAEPVSRLYVACRNKSAFSRLVSFEFSTQKGAAKLDGDVSGHLEVQPMDGEPGVAHDFCVVYSVSPGRREDCIVDADTKVDGKSWKQRVKFSIETG